MSGFQKIVPCAAIAAVLFLSSSSRLTGQISTSTDNGRSFALAGSGDTLPEALDRADAMLSAGELDIAVLQEDTMMPGRAHERLAQFYQGLPVFDAQVVRQMDGRSVISIMGRLYDGIDLDVNPAIAPDQANALALAAAPLGAQIHGATTLGVLAVPDGGYRLAYRMDVRSDWTRRHVYVDAVSGRDPSIDQRASDTGSARAGNRGHQWTQEGVRQSGLVDLSGGRHAASRAHADI